MIVVSQIRRGTIFELDGQLWKVIEYDHYKPGRGNAYVRSKLRNIRSGATVNRTFLSGDKINDVQLDHKTVQYMYNDGNSYYFMDTETFEQIALSKETLEEQIPYMKDNTTIELELYEGEPVAIELPITVDLEVVEAPIGYAGDTANNPTKEVVLETGLKIQVPLFVNQGDVIRIDTRTGEYQTRI